MSFTTDNQTLTDLNILGKYTNNSLFSIFNRTHTPGGEKRLDELFRNPSDDAEEINRRSALFRFFEEAHPEYPFESSLFTEAEHYFSRMDYSNAVAAGLNAARIKFLHYIGLDREYTLMREGLEAMGKLLKTLKSFAGDLEKRSDNLYAAPCREILRILSDSRLRWVDEEEERSPFRKFVRRDHVLRSVLRHEMERLFEIVYDIDVHIAVADTARERGFSYATAYPGEDNRLEFEGVFHPAVKNAVSNDLAFSAERNVVFLTGANMAGKSTLMKALASAVYLAHMGFPVPAGRMDFSVKEGMLTSINVPDDLNRGYSHFYAEVLRVKTVAGEVASGRRLMILFDELFKGTNVKDAYDATVAITEAFSRKAASTFVVSTHIMEAGETLGKRTSNMQFLYLPTEMKGNTPVYPYKLKEGITADRHGMLIIRNEKIMEILKGKE